jgi:hypothetical protein
VQGITSVGGGWWVVGDLVVGGSVVMDGYLVSSHGKYQAVGHQ